MFLWDIIPKEGPFLGVGTSFDWLPERRPWHPGALSCLAGEVNPQRDRPALKSAQHLPPPLSPSPPPPPPRKHYCSTFSHPPQQCPLSPPPLSKAHNRKSTPPCFHLSTPANTPPQPHPPRLLLRQPTQNNPSIPPLKLHLRHQREPARRGPLRTRPSPAVARTLRAIWHAQDLRRHPRLPRTLSPTHPNAANRERIFQAVRPLPPSGFALANGMDGQARRLPPPP